MSPVIGNDSILLRIQIVCLHIVIQFTLMEYSDAHVLVSQWYWKGNSFVHTVHVQ